MSKPKKTAKKKTTTVKVPANIVWFEIPADEIGRARTFYTKLFGWKITKFPMAMEYWHVDTGGADASPDGGLMKRQPGQQGITAYISVPSVDKSHGEGSEARRQSLHVQNGGAADGLLCRLHGTPRITRLPHLGNEIKDAK